jgi:hypothetical protein
MKSFTLAWLIASQIRSTEHRRPFTRRIRSLFKRVSSTARSTAALSKRTSHPVRARLQTRLRGHRVGLAHLIAKRIGATKQPEFRFDPKTAKFQRVAQFRAAAISCIHPAPRPPSVLITVSLTAVGGSSRLSRGQIQIERRHISRYSPFSRSKGQRCYRVYNFPRRPAVRPNSH